jgi:dTDP-4-dehydrorhamnose 3,5-epimerase
LGNRSGAWQLPGSARDRQSVTADWQRIDAGLIEGAALFEMKNVLGSQSHLTEIYRADWKLDDAGVEQVFQTVFEPGGVSAWHAHELTRDRLFVAVGTIRIVLYDGREDSPSFGRINEFRLGSLRPGIVSVPPKVWHGVECLSKERAVLLNLVDRAYRYERPDHFRLPPDSDRIPYRWSRAACAGSSRGA